MLAQRYDVGFTGSRDNFVTFTVCQVCSLPWNERPKIAVFPVSSAFPQEMQMERAKQYCEYLNKIADATQIAYDQTLLCDILKK
jgi:hypothetical protein